MGKLIQWLEKQGHTTNACLETEYSDLWYTLDGEYNLWLPTFEDIERNPRELFRLEAKLNLWRKGLSAWNYEISEQVKYKIVSPDELCDLLLHAHIVACDIETHNANWVGNELLCIGFCIDGNPECCILEDIDVTSDVLHRLALLKNVNYLWHNGLFDTGFLLYKYGVQLPIQEDTLLKHYAQVTEERGTHGLKDLSHLYLNAPDWESELDKIRTQWAKKAKIRKSEAGYDLIPRDSLYLYNARDVYNTWRLYHALDEVAEPDCFILYRQLCSAANTYTRIASTGMRVDNTYLQEYVTQLQGDIETLENTIREEAGVFNINSPSQLKQALQVLYPDIEITSTSKDALFDLPDSVFLSALREYKVKSKLYSTYITGIQNSTCEDNRCRTGFKLHGTSSGRLSSGAEDESTTKFNFQNIGRDKKIKRIFIPEDGYCFMQFDMSGCELRVLAGLSQDPVMIKIFEEGRDLHGEVAASIFGHEYTKEHRQIAKTINFGTSYGMGPKKLKERLHLSGVDVTFNEAQKYLTDWGKQFKKAKYWLDKEATDAMRGKVPVTIYSRKRRFVVIPGEEWKIRNEAKNFKIQSTASDIVLHALLRIEKRLPERHIARIVNTVHDSIVLEVLDTEEVKEQIKNIVFQEMEDHATQLFDKGVPLKADMDIGYSYAF